MIVEQRGEGRARVGDQSHRPRLQPVTDGEGRGRHPGVEVVKPHAVAAAHRQPGLAGAGGEAGAERRGAVVLDVAAGEDHCRSRTGPDGLFELFLEPMVADHQGDQVGGFRERREVGVADQPLDLLVARVDRVERTRETDAPGLHQELAPRHSRPLGSPDDRDRTWRQQRRETVNGSHDAFPDRAYDVAPPCARHDAGARRRWCDTLAMIASDRAAVPPFAHVKGRHGLPGARGGG